MKTNRPPHVVARHRLLPAIDDVDGLEVRLAVRRLHLAVQADGDVGLAGDLLDQIARHALLERVAAHQQRHLARVVGEVQRRLAGRVAGADEVHVLPVRSTRLRCARRRSRCPCR